MANYTEHYNLILPKKNENYNVDVANTNNAAIDTALHEKVSKVAGKGLSTNDFTNEYKAKVDNLSKVVNVKGTVATLQDLQNVLNPKTNDAYLVTSEEAIYGYTEEQEWVNLGSIFNIDIVKEQIKQDLQPIIKSLTITKNTTLTNNYTITLPLQYQTRQ